MPGNQAMKGSLLLLIAGACSRGRRARRRSVCVWIVNHARFAPPVRRINLGSVAALAKLHERAMAYKFAGPDLITIKSA
jgi:hypothetical protein